MTELIFDVLDETRTFLLLHGGGGRATVGSFGDLLARRTRSRVIVPTHPGFGGTPRDERLTDTRALAAAYVALLEELDVQAVTVVGNSFGGWLAAEIALLRSPRVQDVVIIDAVGIDVDGHPLTDVRGLAPEQLRSLSFHDPSKAPMPAGDGAGPSPDVQALLGYTGPSMTDATLRERLAGIAVPVQVLWGEGDGIVDVEYGRAYAAAIPGATFTVLPRTGHLPQLETPDAVLTAIMDRGTVR